MTSQNSITNKKSAGFLSHFTFSLKQSWTLILLFTIILFFVLPVFSQMMISSYDPQTHRELTILREDLTDEWLPVIGRVLVFIGCVFAVVVSCKQFSYTKNKVSTDFFHSLPLTRGQLYLNRLLVCLCALIIPFVIDILLTLTVLAMNSVLTGALFGGILRMLVDVFVYSAFCLALTTLIGMVSGLTPVTLTLTAVALFIVPATFAVTVAFYDIFCEYMWVDFYLSDAFLTHSSPVMRLFMNPDMLSGIEISVMLLISAVMLVGAFFVYRKRRSERSGTPVVFNTLGEVIKYILVFLATLLLGLMFFYIMDESFFWTVFGMACGAVLTFMLTNTILNKTAKSMFKGIKGLAIYGAVIIVGMVLLMTNAFGINSGVPSVSATSHVLISFNDTVSGIELRDKASIEAALKLYNEGEKNLYAWDASNEGNYIHLKIAFCPKIGIPVAKNFSICNKTDFVEQFRTILDSEEFAAQYSKALEELINSDDEASFELMLPVYTVGISNDRLWRDYNHEYYYIHRRAGYISHDYTLNDLALNEILADAKNASFDYFQSRAFGSLRIYKYGMDYSNHIFPLRAEAEGIEAKLIESGLLAKTDAETIDRLTALIDEIKVYEFDAYNDIGSAAPFTRITDKAQIRQILEASSDLYGDIDSRSWYYPSALRFDDREYVAVYELDITDTNASETMINLNEKELSLLDDENGLEKSTTRAAFSLIFRHGMTPAFLGE